MSHALHLVSNNVPGYGPADCRYRSCSGISGRALTLSPCSSYSEHRICSLVKIRSSKCGSRGIPFACKASSSGYRRSPDFSRQRHGLQGRNRQNEDKYSFENLDESEMLSSKNGPVLSLSSLTNFQATAAPSPREKEIVELFKKVQAKLRERAAAKEDKRAEALQRKSNESETVDSLLKLLRKHSVEQGKKNDGIGNSSDLHLDHPEVNDSSIEDKSSSFFDYKKPYAPTLSRPASNFRRKSPVPRTKYQQVYSSEETINSDRNLSLAESPAAPDHLLELESESEPESIYQEPNMLDELSENKSTDVGTDESEQQVEHEDLSALKVQELRALAKSRGLKGFSKMKKSELVVLLS
ncbi:SAP-like protein BP-73 [Gossypium arboreum]|nr:rho-N domain-containing protein 1, chloroplastic-like [Gossypium arboreum]KHG28019.1 SAP-like protein BP-73 [Gossypium arboreum]